MAEKENKFVEITIGKIERNVTYADTTPLLSHLKDKM